MAPWSSRIRVRNATEWHQFSGAGRVFVGWFCPLTPDPSPPAGARGVCCVFYGYESTRREGEPLLSRRSFEPSWGSAGASPSQDCGYGSRIRCRFAVGLSPSPPTPLPRFRGRGEDFRFQLAVGSWRRREVFFESRHRQCHSSLLLGARGSTDVFWDTFFSHAFDSVVGSARSIVTCTA
jgi:hypothetical protein